MAGHSDKNLGNKQGSPCAMNPDEFAAQYRQAYSKLHLVACGIIGDRTHAHDIVQEATIIALEKSNQFTIGTNFLAWISEIVRRCSLNYVKKIRNRKTTPADPDLLANTTVSGSENQTRWPVNNHTGEIEEYQSIFDDEIMNALQEIAPDARCCLLLRTVLNLPYSEISQIMEIPSGTAMSHVHRSKKHLRRKLKHKTDLPSQTKGVL